MKERKCFELLEAGDVLQEGDVFLDNEGNITPYRLSVGEPLKGGDEPSFRPIKVPRWISVQERPPTEAGCRPEDKGQVLYLIEGGLIVSNQWSYWSCNRYAGNKAIAWMPLSWMPKFEEPKKEELPEFGEWIMGQSDFGEAMEFDMEEDQRAQWINRKYAEYERLLQAQKGKS